MLPPVSARPLRREPQPRFEPVLFEPKDPSADVLIALSSCQAYEDNGWNQALRETWLPDLQKHGWEYRFFHGRDAKPGKDIVIVDSHDGYFDLTTKTKEKCRWALTQGFNYIFMCFPDTYVCVERLVNCGFREFDYYGRVHQHPGGQPYCQGGPGYFLNREAAQIVRNDPRNYPNEDCYVGDILSGRVKMGCNEDFKHLGPGPLVTNTSITNHLSTQPNGFSGQVLRLEHRDWLNSHESIRRD